MPKTLLIITVLAVLLLTAFITLFSNNAFVKTTSKTEIETAVNQAKHLYNLRKSEGVDFGSGPCLTEALLPDWVVDIAHSPRQPVDDLPQNQCQSFREGRVKHFVELDLDGNFIRAE